MAARFEDAGIRFRYPENWRLERKESECGWTVELQSPGTAFVMICLREDMPNTDQMAETALAALKDDYLDLEAEDRIDSIAGQPAIGHDVRFYSLDLTNTCWIRSFYCSRGTILVLCQDNDIDLQKSEPVLRRHLRVTGSRR